jgi:peptidoglycan hydrolase CwlO-like protein
MATMKFNLFGCCWRPQDPDPRLDAVLLRLNEVLRLQRTLIKEMQMVQDKIDELKSVVSEQTTVVASMKEAWTRLLAMIEAAKDDPAELDEIIAKARANTASVAEDVARGTAAEGETPHAVQPPTV